MEYLYLHIQKSLSYIYSQQYIYHAYEIHKQPSLFVFLTLTLLLIQIDECFKINYCEPCMAH